MNTAAVTDLVSKLNYDWFKEKNLFFEKEAFYDKKYDKIDGILPRSDHYEDEKGNWVEVNRDIVLDIDLVKYCWSSFFNGSYAEGLLASESEYLSAKFPIDASDIARDILHIIHVYTEKFTDIKAIDVIIKEVIETIKQSVNDLQKSVKNDVYKKVLNDFVVNTKNEISKKFSHIKQQINLINLPDTIERKLTKEICSKIAKFRLGGKDLVTHFEGKISMEEAFFSILNPYQKKLPNVDIYVQSWGIQDVYYLLFKLWEIIPANFSFVDIERKKSLNLKLGGLFKANNYEKFKSKNLQSYIKRHPDRVSEIDSQLASLFKR